MCTKEEVQKIVEESALKTRKEIEQYVNDMFVRRHDSISETVSNQYKEIRTSLNTFADMFKEHIDRIKEVEQDTSELKIWKVGHSIEAKYIIENIDAINDNGKWGLRLLIGAIILALLNLVIV